MKQDRPLAKEDMKRNLDREDGRGAMGQHPVGTGVGAVAGGLAGGAAAGAAAGPIGAVAGGLAGKGIADVVDPTMEDDYWRGNWASRSYIDGGYTYDQDYAPAYRYGWETYPRHAGRSFDEVEAELGADWDNARGESRLDWDRARHATRDSWDRVGERIERAMPGDADGDGR